MKLQNTIFIISKIMILIICCKHLICALPRCNLIKFKILNPYLRELNSINEISKVRVFLKYMINQLMKKCGLKI